MDDEIVDIDLHRPTGGAHFRLLVFPDWVADVEICEQHAGFWHFKGYGNIGPI